MEDAAPGGLRSVEEFVNTRSAEMGTDDVADPAALAQWLAQRGLVPADTRLTAAEHGRALRCREGLRALIAVNAGIVPDTGAGADEAVDPDALVDLAAAASELALVLDVTARPPGLVPRSAKPLDRVLAGFLVTIAEAVAAGTWLRFKVCRQPYCRWAYYDHSRNRSRAWCDMATCGNRAKAHAFRQREHRR
jgi:predicted RNA-binding Zn ribbon-like protein